MAGVLSASTLLRESTAEEILDLLDPEQREVATTVHGPVCVLAGAGTGKTRAITARIAYAARIGVVSPQHALAVTFTTRAAGEMRGRLRTLHALHPELAGSSLLSPAAPPRWFGVGRWLVPPLVPFLALLDGAGVPPVVRVPACLHQRRELRLHAERRRLLVDGRNYERR